jgi:hypothetical protein
MLCLLAGMVIPASAQDLKINDKGYFHQQGVDVMVYSNPFSAIFFDEKRSGIDIIHHGVMTITNGGVRLNTTPEQWDLVPEMTARAVDVSKQAIDVAVKYDAYDFSSTISVRAQGKGILISVSLDRPVPQQLVGKAGFNLEFLPSAYWNKSLIADGIPSYFPRYPFSDTETLSQSEKVMQVGGFSTIDNRGFSDFVSPMPLVQCHELVMAPEDDMQRCIIKSDSTLRLYDGRIIAQNGWFVVNSLLPGGKTGKVLEWYVEPHAKAGWKRQPNIGFSQVGYLPQQRKVAIIELDATDVPLSQATLYRILPDGKREVALAMPVKRWGDYLRYHYVTADFSQVTTPGIYCIGYGDTMTNAFPVSQDVYAKVGDASTDVWLPVQMDHMTVREGYKVWHAAPYLDDARQAPEHTPHFDNFDQKELDSPYASLAFIPGFDRGGWFDAGDFDIETMSHCMALLSLTNAWDAFKPQRDATYINQDKRLTVLHRPDGTPDLLQQIEHGVLPVVNMVEKIGHSCRGINPPYLFQYNRLGDVASITDNQPMTGDERWLFTNHTAMLDYQTVAALAASARALKGTRNELAERCRTQAVALWNKLQADAFGFVANGKGMFPGIEANAALELYATTKDEQYLKVLKRSLSSLGKDRRGMLLPVALKAMPYMDKSFVKQCREAAIQMKIRLDSLDTNNPYGVEATGGNWGSSGQIVNQGITAYWLHRYFPDIVDKQQVYKVADYLFGCHPYSNLSLVMGVGVKPKERAYANNRADFSFIAGGIVPGMTLLQPDYIENKDDWPFFWGQNECTIAGVASYVYFAEMLKELSR